MDREVRDQDKPLYSIGVAADLLEVHPRTLRLYEEAGLVAPARRGGRRLYSANDIKWLRCMRRLIHDEGVNIAGLQKLLRLAPCWEIRKKTCRDHRCCGDCALRENAAYNRRRRGRRREQRELPASGKRSPAENDN